MRLKVKNEPGLERDPATHAIINSDVAAYNKYKQAKARMGEQKEQLENYKLQIADLKNDVADLKQSIASLINMIKDRG